MLHIAFIVLWIIAVIAWLLWFIGYPIYKKVAKKKYFDWSCYALWLNIGALAVNVFNLFMIFTK